MNCVFCHIQNPVFENELAVAVYDRFPVSPGHMLVIPRRHIASFFLTTPDERSALWRLLRECRGFLQKEYKPDGFNIGINDGEAAGQTIFHLHIHLIPRFFGDINNPRGGVRGVIPEKRVY